MHTIWVYGILIALHLKIPQNKKTFPKNQDLKQRIWILFFSTGQSHNYVIKQKKITFKGLIRTIMFLYMQKGCMKWQLILSQHSVVLYFFLSDFLYNLCQNSSKILTKIFLIFYNCIELVQSRFLDQKSWKLHPHPPSPSVLLKPILTFFWFICHVHTIGGIEWKIRQRSS